MPFDLHTHYLPAELADALRQRRAPPWIEALAGGGERLHLPVGVLPFTSDYVDMAARIAFMDEIGVDRQLLSFPGLFGLDSLAAEEAAPLLRLFNDDLAALCASHPDRFSGLAALPFADIERAVAELRRARTELGLLGAIVPVNFFASAAEADRLRPLFAAGHELGAHFFIHPGQRPDQAPAPDDEPPPAFTDNAPARQALAVQHAVASCMVTLLFSDFLDDYADVSVHVANLGGTLPMVIERMDHTVLTRDPDAKLPSTKAGRVHVDCASLGPRAIEIAVDLYGADRVVMGTDCPIFSTAWTLFAIANARIDDADRTAILDTNPRRLLARFLD